MELISIRENIEDNQEFVNNAVCNESIYMSVDFFKRVGYKTPWIGYYAKQNEILVGTGAFKGEPKNGTVEIAYGTFEPFRQQGVGKEICRLLVDLALKTEPAIKVIAHTLPEKNFSTRILTANNFQFSGVVNDPEDGEVWQWVYQNKKN